MSNDIKWTVRKILAWMTDDFRSRGIESARLDAELCAAHALGLERIGLYLDLDRPLIESELAAIRTLVARRRKYEPMAYILGRKEFYGRTFVVNSDVLVPRPDTETLIERALELVPEGESGAQVLDLCTGSGIIGLTLAAERPNLRVDCTDVSEAALAICTQNAQTLGVADRVRVLRGDLFGAIGKDLRYHLITANPPYIATTAIRGLSPDIRDHEPVTALDGGEDGLVFYRRISKGAASHLAPGGAVLLEIGEGQAEAVCHLFDNEGFKQIRVHKDLGGIGRVVEVHSKESAPSL